LAVFGPACCGKEYRVSSAEDMRRVAGELHPGDYVVMSDGPWEDQTILFNARGTARKPITLRAQTPGKVILTGASSVIVDGEHIVVSGLSIKNGRIATNGILLAGRQCRLTETSITDSTYKFFVHLSGFENRMDHCYLAGKTSESPTLQIEATGQPNHHLIDHNHFGPRPPLGRNGGETIRVGYSWQSMSNSATVVEQNLFERCDGEIEIISNKSCENTYRHNTFLDCAGMLTLRHGNRCLVDGNFFLAHHKRGSGGIRVIGESHIVVNNYIDGVSQGGIWITAGIPDSPLKGYFQARDVLVAFNTIVDCAGGCLDLSAGMGSAGRTLLPSNITVANNLLAAREGQTWFKGSNTTEFTWLGNIASARSTSIEQLPAGVRSVEAKLQKTSDGLWRPASSSPVRGTAEGHFAAVRTDVDGQPRSQRTDVGADQISSARMTNRPLTPADVGPPWLTRSQLTGD
jgi:poly(beta-D-mannuronate) lyase